jgi:hypothetical protein
MATEMENIFKNNGNSISLFLHRVILFTNDLKLRRDFGRRHNIPSLMSAKGVASIKIRPNDRRARSRNWDFDVEVLELWQVF